MVTLSILLWETLYGMSVDRRKDLLLGLPQLMDHVELWQIVDPKQTVREPYDQKTGGSMERSTVDPGIVLHEVILLDDPPPLVGDILHRVGVFLGHVLPAEECTILADCVDLQQR